MGLLSFINQRLQEKPPILFAPQQAIIGVLGSENRRKTHNLKLMDWVLFWDLTEESHKTASVGFEELFLGGKRDIYIYIYTLLYIYSSFFAKKRKKLTVEHQKILLITKSKHLKLMILVALLHIGKCKSLGSLKLFLICVNWLSCAMAQNASCFSLPWIPLRAHHGGWGVGWLQWLVTWSL